MEGMKLGSRDNNDSSKRALLRERLTEIKNEVAADYQIPDMLWDQMVSALAKGSPASGGAFTDEELKEFNDETKNRLANFLAEATRGITPGAGGIMFDSQGTVIANVKDNADASRRAGEERAM